MEKNDLRKLESPYYKNPLKNQIAKEDYLKQNKKKKIKTSNIFVYEVVQWHKQYGGCWAIHDFL